MALRQSPDESPVDSGNVFTLQTDAEAEKEEIWRHGNEGQSMHKPRWSISIGVPLYLHTMECMGHGSATRYRSEMEMQVS